MNYSHQAQQSQQGAQPTQWSPEQINAYYQYYYQYQQQQAQMVPQMRHQNQSVLPTQYQVPPPTHQYPVPFTHPMRPQAQMRHQQPHMRHQNRPQNHQMRPLMNQSQRPNFSNVSTPHSIRPDGTPSQIRIKQSLNTPQEIAQWIQERKQKYPTESTIQSKSIEAAEKRQRGDVIDVNAKKPKLSKPKPKQVCKYFSKGHCRHGDKCTRLHETPVLFNPPARRPGLLANLVASDIQKEKNVVLQCIRYLIQNHFFQGNSSSSIIPAAVPLVHDISATVNDSPQNSLIKREGLIADYASSISEESGLSSSEDGEISDADSETGSFEE